MVDFIQINSDDNYYNTEKQISSRTNYFVDYAEPRKLSGKDEIIALFGGKRITYDEAIYNSPLYPVATASIDASGNSRSILALDINYFSTSSVVASYRQGIEIRNEKDWTTGFVKLSAGTPGHIYDICAKTYGINDFSILDIDKYIEIDFFNPITYVETGGDPELFTYPIITSDYNQIENYTLNGIIEPFPIRSVISNFSINFPFEPHSFKGDFGNGNINHRFASQQVLSVDYFEPKRVNEQAFLDADEIYGIGGVVIPEVHFGYLLLDENKVSPFEDYVPPRGEIPGNSYPSDLLNVVNMMLPGGSPYVTNKQRCATSGFVYGDATQGTDSIAYGGLLY